MYVCVVYARMCACVGTHEAHGHNRDVDGCRASHVETASVIRHVPNTGCEGSLTNTGMSSPTS